MTVKIKNLGDEWWITRGDLRVLMPDFTSWTYPICQQGHGPTRLACTRAHGHTGRHAAGVLFLGIRAVWR